MSARPLSPRVTAAVADLRRAAEILAASPAEVAKASSEVCAATAVLWEQGWAPAALSPRDRAILHLAQAAITADASKGTGE